MLKLYRVNFSNNGFFDSCFMVLEKKDPKLAEELIADWYGKKYKVEEYSFEEVEENEAKSITIYPNGLDCACKTCPQPYNLWEEFKSLNYPCVICEDEEDMLPP